MKPNDYTTKNQIMNILVYNKNYNDIMSLNLKQPY